MDQHFPGDLDLTPVHTQTGAAGMGGVQAVTVIGTNLGGAPLEAVGDARGHGPCGASEPWQPPRQQPPTQPENCPSQKSHFHQAFFLQACLTLLQEVRRADGRKVTLPRGPGQNN